MLRTSLLYLSRQQGVFNFIRNVGFARKMASRFVAGETIATALDAVAALNAKGISASLDLLERASPTKPKPAKQVGSTSIFSTASTRESSTRTSPSS